MGGHCMDTIASTADAVVVILAAGLSTRMGRRKPDLPWLDGHTLLSHVRRTVDEAGLPSIVVAGAPARAGDLINPQPEHGISSSLKLGFEYVRRVVPDAAVGVMLADQPFVSSDDIRAVYRRFRERAAGVHAVRPRYRGVPGHPVFFDQSWDALIASLAGDEGLGRLFKSRTDALWLDREALGRPDPAFDVDTPDAYERAVQWAKGGLEGHDGK